MEPERTFYPIEVSALKPYEGNNSKRQLARQRDERTAQKIAKYINYRMQTRFKDRESVEFTFAEIATALNLPEIQVYEYLRAFSCGSKDGIEVHNPKS